MAANYNGERKIWTDRIIIFEKNNQNKQSVVKKLHNFSNFSYFYIPVIKKCQPIVMYF